MRYPRAAVFAFFLASAAPQDLPPAVLLVSRVKTRLRQQVARLPQYTCLETIDRSQAAAPGKRLKALDTVRLEVLFSGKREQYAAPGERSFQDRSPIEYVSGGMMSDGIFASSLVNIFIDENGLFTYRGEDDVAGRPAFKWDYKVPLLNSGHHLTVPAGSAVVAERGTFWADRDSLDLIRLDIHADEVPAFLDVQNAEAIIDYARMRIGDESVLLPQSAMVLLTASNSEMRDRFEFTHCRSYQVQSILSFGAPISVPVENSLTQPLGLEVVLSKIAAGLQVAIALTRPIDERAAVGDPIEGKISGAVKQKNTVVIPDGAPVHGRIRRLEHYSEDGGYFIVGLEFDAVSIGETESRFYADLKSADPAPGFEWYLTTNSEGRTLAPGGGTGTAYMSTTERIRTRQLPGVGTFFMRGSHFRLPEGYKLTWKTRAY